MKLKVSCVYTVFILLLTSIYAEAQNTRVLPATGNNTTSTDTIPVIELDESSLDQLIDIKEQFEIQNSTYSAPVRPSSNLLRFLKKDEPTLSNEALYWARLVRDASSTFNRYMTFRDTIIADPIFLPPIFRGNVLPEDLSLYDGIIYQSKSKDPYEFLYQPDTTLFANFMLKKKTDQELQRYMENNHLASFNFSERDLPGETVKTSVIRRPISSENISLKVEPEVVKVEEMESLPKFIPDRQYWQSAFESAIQFSQNYISPNWHKGGSSNLNLFTKNYLKYDYNKDKVQLTNEMEIKVSFYNAPKDTIRSYKIGDDILRLHSNFGYKAFNKWFYTLDGEFKTQIFQNFQENSDIRQAAFLAPFAINLGLGMKYDLSKTYKTRHKNLKLSVNMAPISFTYMYSIRKDTLMDLGRHGFDKKPEPIAERTNPYKHTLSRFGSTLRADMTMNFSRNISWQSRVYYFTTYENVVAEFENTLILAVTRHFSTRIYAHLRYDDSVKKTEDFDSYFQLNELLSFGFNYKW